MPHYAKKALLAFKAFQKSLAFPPMARHALKILLALGLAFLIYFIGIQGCANTQFATLSETVGCEEFPTAFECEAVPAAADPFPEERDDRDERRERDAREERDDRDERRERRESRRETDERDREANRRERDPPPPQKYYLEFKYKLSSGKVDILFVIDNSSSMAKEHRSLAGQFKSFLREIKDVNYHIAVITTDISSSPENPIRNAYYQDGKFIPIGGQLFLRNQTMGNDPDGRLAEAFKTAIAREETANCDQRNQPQSYDDPYDQLYAGEQDSLVCPSHDERGIYAINLAIRNHNQESFFRPDAHLMIVILSDEDERSSKSYIEQPGFEYYAFEDFDYPEVLAESFSNRFGALKSFSVHSIIIPPGDKRCLDEQNRGRGKGEGAGRGYYGEEYARLSWAKDFNLTQYGNLLEGSVISICDRSYGSQLQKVGLSARTIRIALPCGQPESMDLYVDGRRIRKSAKRIEGRTLIMETGAIRLNSEIEAKVICPE